MRKPAISSNDIAVGYGIVKKFAIIETADKLNSSILIAKLFAVPCAPTATWSWDQRRFLGCERTV